MALVWSSAYHKTSGHTLAYARVCTVCVCVCVCCWAEGTSMHMCVRVGFIRVHALSAWDCACVHACLCCWFGGHVHACVYMSASGWLELMHVCTWVHAIGWEIHVGVWLLGAHACSYVQWGGTCHSVHVKDRRTTLRS